VLRFLQKTKQKAGESMKKFEGRSDGGMSITENQAQIHLAPHEADALWQWLSARKDAFQAHSSEVHLYQKDLSHIDELKAAIPELHARGPIVRVLDARWKTITERALQLLKEFQIENHVHPVLEDDSTYAQG
jgi:hypothetical protein